MQPQKAKSYDVCIVGGGLVGSILALALSQGGMSVALIDNINKADNTPEKDARTTAYAYASIQLFKNLGIWDDLEPHGHPIAEIRISDHTSYSFVHYGPKETNGEIMGVIIPNGHVQGVLKDRMASNPHIDLHIPKTVAHWVEDKRGVTLTLSDGNILWAQVLVGADGRASGVRGDGGLPYYTWDYHQTALVGFIQHEFCHHNHAFEHFLPTGPLALLPMGAHRSSFVWTLKNRVLPDYLSLSPHGFAQAMEGHFEPTLGAITLTSPIQSYPLSGVFVPSLRRKRLVLVGDSGHVIHPVAGQGLNLGLRDVGLIYDLLMMGKKNGLDLGSDTVLSAYNRQRQWDILSMTALTDGIVRLFSNDIKPLTYIRRAGLDGVQMIPFFKKRLVNRARGMLRNRPSLLCSLDFNGV